MGLKKWYFKDGTPINPESIRRIVKYARVTDGERHPGDKLVSRNLITAVARYFAKKMEANLIKLLLAEFDSLPRHPGKESRAWRRCYMRGYRSKNHHER